MKKQNIKYLLVLLFSILINKVKANPKDSINVNPENRLSIEYSGGITFTNYLFKSNTSGLFGSPSSIKNINGKLFQFNVKIPINKSKVSVNLGFGHTERNYELLFNDGSLYFSGIPVKSLTFTQPYQSLILGVGYKFVNLKRILVDADLGVSYSFSTSTIMVTKFYPITDFLTRNIASKSFICPAYFKVNTLYNFNKHNAIGVNLGLFYDLIEPRYENLIETNRLNYSLNLVLRYNF